MDLLPTGVTWKVEINKVAWKEINELDKLLNTLHKNDENIQMNVINCLVDKKTNTNNTYFNSINNLYQERKFTINQIHNLLKQTIMEEVLVKQYQEVIDKFNWRLDTYIGLIVQHIKRLEDEEHGNKTDRKELMELLQQYINELYMMEVLGMTYKGTLLKDFYDEINKIDILLDKEKKRLKNPLRGALNK